MEASAPRTNQEDDRVQNHKTSHLAPVASMTLMTRGHLASAARLSGSHKLRLNGSAPQRPINAKVLARSTQTPTSARRRSSAGANPLCVLNAVTTMIGGAVLGPSKAKFIFRSALLGVGAVVGMRALPGWLLRRAPPDGSTAPSGAGARKPAIVWFRNDLRTHDHEALHAAQQGHTSVLPLYCFDPREYGKTAQGYDKTGPQRAKFILDSLADLRARLRERGSDLIIRVGRPEEVIPQLLREVQGGTVYCHREVAYEDAQAEACVHKAVEAEGGVLKCLWGSNTLYHMEDLPFKLKNMPVHYGDFCKRMVKVAVRPFVQLPQQLKGLPLGTVDPGTLPSLQQLGFSAADLAAAPARNPLGGMMHGGETEAFKQLKSFIGSLQQAAAGQHQQQQQRRSAGSTSQDFTCKMNTFLALGCLSPRQMYAEARKQLGSGNDKGAEPWLFHELAWRDFFRYMTKKYSDMGLSSSKSSQSAAAAPAAALVPA